MKKLILIPILFFTTILISQDVIKVASWNVESGKNDPNYISKRLKDFESYDLVGLSEVDESNKEAYDKALGEKFKTVIGSTGRSDRLFIAYNKERYELIDKAVEIDEINIDGTVRAPLYVELKDKKRNVNLIFMVNHLARGDKSGGTRHRRKVQAQMLNEWVEDFDIPVISVGDFNFDFQIEADVHKPAFDEMLKDQNFFWIYPSNFQRTQCNLNYKAAILDFVFVNRKALIFSPTCEIQEHPDNCKDWEKNSDHKAILATFKY